MALYYNVHAYVYVLYMEKWILKHANILWIDNNKTDIDLVDCCLRLCKQ